MTGRQQDRVGGPNRAGTEWPFFGRDAELDVVAGTLAGTTAAPDGVTPAGVVVVGPSGVGKTRLLREVRRWAEGRGLPTATVLATASASQVPLGALRHLVPHAVGAGELTDRAATRRSRPEGHPTVLLVDDAHHLDAAGAALLLQLVLEGVAAPVVAVRLGQPVPDALRSLWKNGLLLRVDLPAFSPEELGELIERALGAPVSDRTRASLAAVCDGNVLYARELVGAAVAARSLQLRDGTWVWDERVVLGPRLVDAVWERLEALSVGESRALALVALAEPLTLGVAERLTPREVLAGLEEAGLVRLDDSRGDAQGLRLAHPLYGEVLLGRLGRLGRRHLEAELAVAVGADEEPSELDRLRAVTWRLDAGLGVAPEVLLGAAAHANQHRDHQLAARLARAALHQVDRAPSAEVPPREPVVLELAEALTGGAAADEARALLDDIEEAALAGAADPFLDAYLDTRFRAAYLEMGRAAEVRSLLRRVVRLVGEDGPRRHAVEVYRASIALGEGHPDEAARLAEPLLDEPGLTEVQRLLAAETVGEAMCYLGQPGRAGTVRDRLRALAATRHGTLRVAAVEAELQASFEAQLDGRVADALPDAVSLRRRLEGSPDIVHRGLASLLLGRGLLLAGHLAQARAALLDAAADLRREDIGGSEAWALVLLSQTAALEGRAEAAQGWRDDARACRRSAGTARDWADLVAADVWLEVAAGDLVAARRRALDGADRFPAMHLPRATLLHLAVRAGDRSDEVTSALRRIGHRVEAGYPGLLADHADAVRRCDGAALDQVAERFAARGLTPLAAEASLQAAHAHQVAGSDHGAHRATARATRLAGATGPVSTPALAELSSLVSLSRRELDIARQAAAGLSNADIASRFVLSVRTVESHLYRAFAKLGISSRAELEQVLPVGSTDAATGA